MSKENIPQRTTAPLSRKFIILFFCFSILIYTIFALFSITEPSMGDSIIVLISAKVFNNELLRPYFSSTIYSGAWHPPLYVHMLALIHKVMNLNPINARLIGIFSFIITFILIYIISQRIFVEGKDKCLIGLISTFLYAINPMAIQGSLLPDIDTTILVPLLLLFIYLFVRVDNKNKYLILGMSFGLLLWAKLTTPFALIPAIFIFRALNGNIKKGIKESSLILFIGFFIFVIPWLIYCYINRRPFHYPFLNAKNSFLNNFFVLNVPPSTAILKTIRTLVRLLLYISPFYFLMYVMAFWHRIKEFNLRKKLDYTDFLLILSLIILFGYLLIGGLTYSFPKYHYPFLSLSAVIVASFIYDKLEFKRKHLFLYVTAIIIIAAYNIFWVGDFLYTSDYGLRENLIIAGRLKGEAIMSVIMQLIFYILPFFFVLAILKIINSSTTIVYRIVFIWTIASCLSMNILQVKADYHTVYCYGGKGTKEAISFLRGMQEKGKSILATEDIYYNIDEKIFLSFPDYCLSAADCSDPKRFMLVIESKKPDCIVFSISSNTVKQYNEVFNNPTVIDFLKQYFLIKRIGSYTIWLRRDSI